MIHITEGDFIYHVVCIFKLQIHSLKYKISKDRVKIYKFRKINKNTKAYIQERWEKAFEVQQKHYNLAYLGIVIVGVG